MPFTLRNIKEDLEDIGARFDGAPDLEFRAATAPLELEKSGPSYQRGAKTSTAGATGGPTPNPRRGRSRPR